MTDTPFDETVISSQKFTSGGIYFDALTRTTKPSSKNQFTYTNQQMIFNFSANLDAAEVSLTTVPIYSGDNKNYISRIEHSYYEDCLPKQIRSDKPTVRRLFTLSNMGTDYLYTYSVVSEDSTTVTTPTATENLVEGNNYSYCSYN